jgi:hypothetical protein
MKERALNFKRNDDPTIVELDVDTLKKAKDIYSKLALNLSFCLKQGEDGALTQGMLETHLSLAEHYTKDFTEMFNYEGVLKKESEKRFEEIRAINKENIELRNQLGMKVTNEDFRERCKILKQSVRDYFDSIGLFLSGASFTPYGYFEGTLSCIVMSHKKDKASVLESRGVELDFSDGIGIIANDNNKEILKEMMLEQYPSCNIHEVLEWHSARRENCQIKDIKISITNLDDIKIQKGDS